MTSSCSTRTPTPVSPVTGAAYAKRSSQATLSEVIRKMCIHTSQTDSSRFTRSSQVQKDLNSWALRSEVP